MQCIKQKNHRTLKRQFLIIKAKNFTIFIIIYYAFCQILGWKPRASKQIDTQFEADFYYEQSSLSSVLRKLTLSSPFQRSNKTNLEILIITSSLSFRVEARRHSGFQPKCQIFLCNN